MIKKMKEVYGKYRAGGIPGNNGVKMIVSLMAVTLFIGMAMQAAIADYTPSVDPELEAVEENCSECGFMGPVYEKPKCETCVQAVFHAVEYMIGHVKDNLPKKVYFLKTADASILIFNGLVIGLLDSGFRIKIDYDDLHDTINFWVKKLVGPQLFFITRFMARLGAISIGITFYLLSFCVDPSIISPK